MQVGNSEPVTMPRGKTETNSERLYISELLIIDYETAMITLLKPKI